MPVGYPDDLQWDTEYLSDLMRRKKVHDRRDLARLIDVPLTTVYRYMDPDWTGRIHLPTLAAIASVFNVHPGRLIADTRHPSPRHD